MEILLIVKKSLIEAPLITVNLQIFYPQYTMYNIVEFSVKL
jgi:hypothetical protein